MTPEQKQSLQDSVFRHTAQDPLWLGYWLQHYVDSENRAWPQLAQEVGITTENLVLLCLCRTPRPDCFQEDLRAVCQRTGAREDVLACILRQEQAMMHWRGQEPAGASGWLLAASDRQEPSDSEQATELDDDED